MRIFPRMVEVDNTIVWLRRQDSLLKEAIKQVMQQPRNSLHLCLFLIFVFKRAFNDRNSQLNNYASMTP